MLQDGQCLGSGQHHQILIEREENEEVLALYGGGRYFFPKNIKIGMLQYEYVIPGPQKEGSYTLTFLGLQQQHLNKL